MTRFVRWIRWIRPHGIVVRGTRAEHAQGMEVSLCPHAERDRIVEGFRREVRSTVRSAVQTYGLERRDRRAHAAGLLIQLVHGLHLTAMHESERLWWRRAIVRRRKAREAAGLNRW